MTWTECKSHSSVFCESLPVYLESGASDERLLYLLGAGLSRNIALEIFEVFSGALPNWSSITETLTWLRVNVPVLRTLLRDELLFKEIERVLA